MSIRMIVPRELESVEEEPQQQRKEEEERRRRGGAEELSLLDLGPPSDDEEPR
jgi:hypothetical protein